MASAAVVDKPSFSTFLDAVLDRLSSPEIVNLIRKEKLDHMLLQRLETTLHAIQVVLNDAEHKQIQNSEVKKWLDYLRHAAYVADGLSNQVFTKSETQEEVSELKDIIHTLEFIVEHKDFLGLKEISRENLSARNPISLVEGYNICGRYQDKEAIIKLLLDDNSDAKISVIPIVGMGGIGKTTLAQLVYNDDNLMQKFDFKVWVCVAEDFDILKVTKTITEAVTSSTCDIEDLNLLQLRLKEKVSGKKLLIVLDDVLSENDVNWNTFQIPFQDGMKGNKILVTTRSEYVASSVRTVPEAYHLHGLSHEDCWLVFENRAFLSSEFSENLIREKLGREIVKKCKGLPLALQTLGGLLRTKHNIRDWNTILMSDTWKSYEDETTSIPALKICYDYLPAHLRECFAYCSLYSKGYMFNKDELISLWMEQRLLLSSNSEKTLEEVGNEYLMI